MTRTGSCLFAKMALRLVTSPVPRRKFCDSCSPAAAFEMGAIDYAEIDCEIRPLIEYLNLFPGIETLQSCAGHTETEEAYVTFTAADALSLERLLRALPFIGARCVLVQSRLQTQCVSIRVSLGDGSRLTWRLSLAGSPQYIQRQLIGNVENSLRAALGSIAQRATHLPCSRNEAARSADSQPGCPEERS